MAEPSRKKQRRHLNYDKCQFCRRAKKACTPVGRTWPEKCHRCSELELVCSENSRAAGAPPLMAATQPTNQPTEVTKVQKLHDLSLRLTWLRRLRLYQNAVKVVIDTQEDIFARKFFGWRPTTPTSLNICNFINEEESLLFAYLMNEGTRSNNPLAAFIALSLDTEATSFRGHPLLSSCAVVPKTVDRLRESGDIGTALAIQEILLFDKRNNPNRVISKTELKKYCDIYLETIERLRIITGHDVSVLSPLHNLLLLTQGDVKFPSSLPPVLPDYLGRSLPHLALDLGVRENVLCFIKSDQTTTAAGDAWGRQPIHIACSAGLEAAVRHFLNKRVDLGVTDMFGRSPLHYASASGKEKIIQLLVGPDERDRVESGNEATAQVVPRCSVNINCEDQAGFSPLMWAVVRGHMTTVQVLLESGADVNTKDELRRTPLIVAAERGQTDVARILIDMGADVYSEDKNGNTPIFSAVKNGHVAVIQLLLQRGVDVNFRDALNETPLSAAVKNGNKAVIQLLLQSGGSANTEDISHQTPLSVAASRGHFHIVRLLLQNGANPNGGNTYPGRPLYEAAEQGHGAIVWLLLDNDANLNVVTHASVPQLSIAGDRRFATVAAKLRGVLGRWQYPTRRSALSIPPHFLEP